jgi:hypothetical protein
MVLVDFFDCVCLGQSETSTIFQSIPFQESLFEHYPKGPLRVDPFRIICPACSTKLVVRQPELVGRTVPCPKCKNAIHVVRPGEVAWNPGTVGPNDPKKGPDTRKAQPTSNAPKRPINTVNSEAITKADPGDWDLESLESALAQQSDATADTQPGEFFREPGVETPADRKRTTEPFEIQPLDPSAQNPSASSVGPSAWQSPQAKARRQLLTVFIVGIAGCLLAALAFIAFLNAYGKKTREKPNLDNQPAVLANAPEAANANPIDPAAPPELVVNAGPKIEAIQPVDPADPNEPVAQEAPGLKVNPLGIPPENIQPTPLNPNEEPSAQTSKVQENNQKQSSPQTNPDQPADDSLPTIFKDFLPVFDRSSQPGWSDLGKEGDKTIDQELSLENSQVAFAQEYFPQPIPIPNWTERSERRLGRIRMPAMNLSRFAHWIHRISGHPISLDWFLFNLSDIPLDQTFELQSDGTTIGGILEDFKNKIGAVADVDTKGFVYLRPAPEKIASKLKLDGSTELGPLAKGLPEGQDQAILKLVLEMLQIDGCEYKDGKLSWGHSSNPYQQAQVLAALDSIREAIRVRGVQEANTNSANPLFDFNRPSAWVALFRQSQTKLSPQEVLYEERPIVDIMARAAQASQTELLVDWPSAWSHGLHSNRMALSLLRGRTMLEISNRFLDDHSLELVPLDSKTWMLTTESQRRSMIRLIAVRTDRGVSLDDIKVSLRGLVPRDSNGKSLFRSANVPGADGVVLLRICPPSSNLMFDDELASSLGLSR